MKKLVMPSTAALFAILVAIGVAFAGYNLLKGLKPTRAKTNAPVIGEIQSITGEVEHRLPLAVRDQVITDNRPLHDKELVITHRASEATLVFEGGTALRLSENSRIIAERDATRADAVVLTLLEGHFNVLSAGRAKSVRVYKDGREISLAEAKKTTIPLIRGRPEGAPPVAPTITTTNPPVIAASTPDESIEEAPRATPPRQLPAKRPLSKLRAENLSSDSLTNEEITRQLRSQTSFFQRCYLTYVNRLEDKSRPPSGGTVTVGFTIQPSGRTTGVKVVRTDFQDPTLTKCVSDVVARTSFKSFNADAIPVLEFPISLQ